MADIELTIKIDEEIYNHTQKYEIGGFNQENDTKVFMAIKNGTPLPAGHGKLVDINSIPKEDRHITVKSLLYPGTIACAGAITLEEYVNNLPPIIEADIPKKRKGTPLEENDFGYNCENWIP